MDSKPFEIIDHTADIGVRTHGRDLPEVMQRAAEGMFHVILGGAEVHPVDEEVIEIEGDDAVDLMVRWLGELLFRFDARKRVYREFQVEMPSPKKLRARVRGERLDLARHQPQMEIKAVTYCGARVEQRGGEWFAEVVFDI